MITSFVCKELNCYIGHVMHALIQAISNILSSSIMILSNSIMVVHAFTDRKIFHVFTTAKILIVVNVYFLYTDQVTLDQTLSSFIIYYAFNPQLAEITYSVEVNLEVLWMERPNLVVSLLTMDYNINFDQNTVILELPDAQELRQPSVPLWVLFVYILFATIIVVSISSVVYYYLYFRLKHKTDLQVTNESVNLETIGTVQETDEQVNLVLSNESIADDPIINA